MDPQGKVTGLLDIAKCLYDAVHRLEKAAKKKAEEEEEGGGGGGGGNVAMLGAVMEAAKSIKGKATARNQQALQVTWEGEEGRRRSCPPISVFSRFSGGFVPNEASVAIRVLVFAWVAAPSHN